MDTPAIRELFNEDDLVFIKKSDPRLLADAILILKNNPEKRMVIAKNSHKKFMSSATMEILGRELKEIASKLL